MDDLGGGGEPPTQRTGEQRAADEALTLAVEQVMAAYGFPDGFVTTEYIAVVSGTRWDDDGEPMTAYSVIHKDGDVPIHRAMGLALYALKKYEGDVMLR